jgi:hypothetical protein
MHLGRISDREKLTINPLQLYRKRIILLVMQRSMLLAVLTISLLITMPAAAQHGGGSGGGGSHGGGSHPSGGNGISGGHHGAPISSSRRGYRRYGNYGWGYGSWYYPGWGFDDGFDSYPESGPEDNAPGPPVVLMQSSDRRPSAAAPVAEAPRLIEVPLNKEADSPAKPEPPTLFVLANGERLEASRYTLTADSIRVEVGREERTISLAKLNIDATVAANRERGIDLMIPRDKNQLFVSF